MFSGFNLFNLLTEVNLETFDTKVVTNINSMLASFFNCITYLDLSAFDIEKCKAFTNILIK
jgi:hypothetical protein